MYKYRHVISAVILTFILTTAFWLCIGSDIISYIGAANGNFPSKLNHIQNIIEKFYINDYNSANLETNALEGYVKGLGDPYAEYISPEEIDEYMSSTTGNYKGIGVEVYIDEDDLITVSRVNENSPAFEVEIKPGDKIIKADEVFVSVKNYDEALNIIKGVDDTDDNVKITIKRGEEEIEKDIIRRFVQTDYVTEEMIDGIYYISLSSFEGDSADQFNNAITNAEKEKAKGIIIDLRGNPGGILENVVAISDRILKEGKILTIKDKAKNEDVYKAKDKIECTIPICVLVNGASASASEVLAASLKDNGKATLVGTKTYGKGVVQTIFQVDDSSLIKLTTAKYYTPSGVCIDKIGITPDKVVEIDEKYSKSGPSLIPREVDTQLKEALNILKWLKKVSSFWRYLLNTFQLIYTFFYVTITVLKITKGFYQNETYYKKNYQYYSKYISCRCFCFIHCPFGNRSTYYAKHKYIFYNKFIYI